MPSPGIRPRAAAGSEAGRSGQSQRPGSGPSEGRGARAGAGAGAGAREPESGSEGPRRVRASPGQDRGRQGDGRSRGQRVEGRGQRAKSGLARGGLRPGLLRVAGRAPGRPGVRSESLAHGGGRAPPRPAPDSCVAGHVSGKPGPPARGRPEQPQDSGAASPEPSARLSRCP